MVDKWSISTRIFHWLSVLMLIGAWASVEVGKNVTIHKALGVSILFWTLARLINRFANQSPAHLPAPKWQNMIAGITHIALYVMILAMPAAGVLMSMYGGHAINMFGLFDIPVMVTPDRAMSKFFRNAHEEILWPLLMLFTILHIAGALYHQFIMKDNIIARMK